MDKIEDLVKRQRTFFQTGKTKKVAYRKEALTRLLQQMKVFEPKIMEALKQDLNKSEFESYMSEIGMVYDEIRFAIKNVGKWSKRTKVKSTTGQFPAKSYIMSEPYGVVLIMAPWNYPFQLSIAPLIGAIAAGNCAVVKPSEYSAATSKVLKELMRETFAEDYVCVVEGDVVVSKQVLEQHYDYIFYTGGEMVGKLVMESAAKHLTPVSLELGGKSPTIVEKSANIRLAAKRIAFGKFLNAGQTCVAPDYVFVEREVEKEFLSALSHWIMVFFGEDVIHNEAYPKLIHAGHFSRVASYIKQGTVAFGGRVEESLQKIEPTILTNVNEESPVMKEEIFGPVLPVLTFDKMEEVIAYITAREKPLACYLFTTDKQVEQMVLSKVSFGGGCINDTILHLATPYMGFGGVGTSGMGSYHGKQSFDTFSHKKSILKKANYLDIPLRYQPYTDKKYRMLKKIMK